MEAENVMKPVPRELKTPLTEACSVVSMACDAFIGALGRLLVEQGDDPEEFFFTHVFGKAWDNNEIDGDKEEQRFFDDFDQAPEETAKFAVLRAISIAVSYAVQAMRARKNSGRAWSFAGSAMYWAGILKATPLGGLSSSEAASELAKKRHAEHYALEMDALQYWRENIDTDLSAERAANELIKVVPLSHKKLAVIVSKAKKERREASEGSPMRTAETMRKKRT